MVVEGEEGSREVGKGYIEKYVIATGRVGRGWGVGCLVSFGPHVLHRGKIL